MKQPPSFSTGDPSYFVTASTLGSVSPTARTVSKLSFTAILYTHRDSVQRRASRAYTPRRPGGTMSIRSLLRVLVVGFALTTGSASVVFAQSHFAGTTGPGSSYEIDVPAVWNGDLVLYAHGIVQAEQPVVPPTNQDGYNLLRAALLNGGYAVAASSFSSNGWSLDDAVRRTHQLSGIFKSTTGHP